MPKAYLMYNSLLKHEKVDTGILVDCHGFMLLRRKNLCTATEEVPQIYSYLQAITINHYQSAINAVAKMMKEIARSILLKLNESVEMTVVSIHVEDTANTLILHLLKTFDACGN